ncbi:YchJ family metal-binding protein [Arsukibacterium sp.]|uniref:YchJ family protein n=1 Tax=Arsukibacterium sp. TaxID=1977258 RepID=UPI002616FEC2|nr:YchJ family metal-binding protein [Arsukibacterium sp.]
MRSRYSAYCLKDTEYLFQTCHPEQRGANSKFQISEFANAVHFVGLTITDWSESRDTRSGNCGSVSFVARYISGTKLETLTEKSRFVLKVCWYYCDGEITATPTLNVGRNERCPCGSGKKFKQCSVHLLSGAAPAG